MKHKKLWTPVIIIVLLSVMAGVSGIIGPAQGQDGGSSEGCAVGEHGAEHSSETDEGGAEHGSETDEGGAEHGSETGESGAEGRGTNALALDERYDTTQNGARLIMRYDATGSSFVGTVENASDALLTRVRVEVHLSNGVELGPTAPTDLAPGEVLEIALPAGSQPFDTWYPHAETGTGEACGEGGDPSSPILALNESWDGAVNGLRIAMSYDAETGSFAGTVENASSQTLCAVQIELNLKQGTATVVELGPQPVGDLAPGTQMPVELLLADEPLADGIAFDGWEIHPEVFSCQGSSSGNAEGGAERGEGRGAERGEGRGEGRGD